MTVEEAIKHLQQFDPQQDLLVEAIDGGDSYAVYRFVDAWWTEDDGSQTPIIKLMLEH
jgi:hypothetical protein